MDGVWTYCFDNTMSTVSTKTIGFYLHNVEDRHSGKSRQKGMLATIMTERTHAVAAADVDPLENQVDQLIDNLNLVQAEQDYIAERERVHRDSRSGTL